MTERLKKIVNGELVEMSAEEEAEIRAFWAENEAKAEPAILTREEFCVALIAPGIFTEEEATEAALGAWPLKFEPALAGKSLVEKLTIKNIWKEAKTVSQDSQLFLDLLDFYAAKMGLNNEQKIGLSNTIFGV